MGVLYKPPDLFLTFTTTRENINSGLYPSPGSGPVRPIPSKISNRLQSRVYLGYKGVVENGSFIDTYIYLDPRRSHYGREIRWRIENNNDSR